MALAEKLGKAEMLPRQQHLKKPALARVEIGIAQVLELIAHRLGRLAVTGLRGKDEEPGLSSTSDQSQSWSHRIDPRSCFISMCRVYGLNKSAPCCFFIHFAVNFPTI